ncbi:hypothetical protein [Nocardioides sp. AE5]|uniref:hypothetical protein n=1 Tax=Nocardioides sp. AE5 TaxID=2962573 RepID=UPI0028829F5D|nr:hypothetical protein [Nocardioides sp. AE5]MDT0203297.1 hypothetical protein [Nocardioides sp. AE5]
MTPPNRRSFTARPALVSLALVAGLALGACSGDDGEEADKEPTAEPTMVDGVTVEGLDLAFGERATFVWEPSEGAAGKVEATVEGVKVVSMDDFAGYQLTDDLRASTPYFVEVSVTNVGDADVGGSVLPIYLDNGSATLFPSVVFPNYDKCGPRALPEEFAKDATADLCLVFFAPKGTELRSLALLPREGFEQIDWTGQVSEPPAPSASADVTPDPSASPTG